MASRFYCSQMHCAHRHSALWIAIVFFFRFVNSARTILAPENAKIVHSTGGYSGFSILLALFIDENSPQ